MEFSLVLMTASSRNLEMDGAHGLEVRVELYIVLLLNQIEKNTSWI